MNDVSGRVSTTSAPAQVKLLHIAWLGSLAQGGGVAGFGFDLVRGLLKRGHRITMFTSSSEADLTPLTSEFAEKLVVVRSQTNWQWNRWYSRDKLSAFISGSISRVGDYRRRVSMLVDANRREPFDVILQFSQSEIFNLSRHLATLPPVLLFPCVHAAGELRWHRLESSFAREHEPAWRHYLTRLMLKHRTHLQRKTYRRVFGVIGMSERFNALVREDYGVDPSRQAVVYQPLVDSAEPVVEERADPELIRLVFPARLSVRKGLDLIIDLSHRLKDLAGRVEIVLVGGCTLWSDYSGHLSKLNPAVARSIGSVSHVEMLKQMANADALVLPSKYEPGGIVVAEALSMGCCCVVSDEVGSAENLRAPACRHFHSGDVVALEAECRKLISEIRADRTRLRQCARIEAELRFSERETIDRFESALAAAAARKPLTLLPLNDVPPRP